MRRNKQRVDDQAEINITPMLDIVFIMLIFFIVTTSFVKEIAVDVSRPSSEPPKEQKLSEVIAIRISGSGQISVQERVIDIRAVRANIETALAARPDASVVVIASREADAGLLVRVIDQARVAGAAKVSLAAEAT
ncbi:MAG: biopolymer transporter ExbD [Gammaproteobacteria bacterium]|nr:biopolymer transporter ExbD [Gammaproteobacteria bacterium]NNF61626.1 biopolymer transporter ExbD [Gammaproteobacteria bacterium]NNM20568.1 biopolymer transporter ExbD [Gammaproteobacteria bacterium]